MEFALPSVGLLGLLTPSFLYLPIGIGMSNLYVSQNCILDARNLSGFTDSQLERTFASG